MKKYFTLLVMVAVAFTWSNAAAAEVVPGRVLVQLEPSAHQSASYRAELGIQGRTGLPDLDVLLAEIGAHRVAPALRFPPAADNEPARRLRRYLVIEYAGGADPQAVAELMKQSPQVQAASPEGVAHLAVEPDDPLFPDQWAHRNTGQAVDFNGNLVGTQDCDSDTDLAWEIVTGDSEIVMAIIDTGVDLEHEEFTSRLTAGYDFYNDDDDPADDNGHGTACAGIAAAAANNQKGITGVGWGVQIMPVKVFNSLGHSSESRIISGIIWAVDHGAQILSLSLTVSSPTPALEDAVAYAHQLGCPVFCASGNYNNPTLGYPAGYTDYTIPVGALSPCNERKSPTSCDGEDWWGSNYGALAFLAPGVRMHTADITGEGGYTSGDYTPDFNGTSAATPHAAAIGALVLSLNPALTPNQLEYRLTQSSEDMGDLGVDAETGFGRLNAHLAVLSAFTVPEYVRATYIGLEYGTLHRPFNTLAEAVAAAPQGGTIVVFAGTYAQPLTITKNVRLLAKDGIATIGQ